MDQPYKRRPWSFPIWILANRQTVAVKCLRSFGSEKFRLRVLKTRSTNPCVKASTKKEARTPEEGPLQ